MMPLPWFSFRLGLFLQVLALAIREDGSEFQQTYDLPKNCDKLGRTTKCCACGELQKFPGTEAKFEIESQWGWKADICGRTEDTEAKRVCCPLWATDCQDTDPYFFVRMVKDCKPKQETCYKYECHDILKEYKTAERELRKIKGNRPQDRWADSYITGESNHYWTFGCDCACGKLVNESSFECRSLNKAMVCPDVRPCCTKLEDCKPEDPWPAAVAENAKLVKKQTKSFSSRAGMVQRRVRQLQNLLQDCTTSCVTARISQCLSDLKSTKKKKLFGSRTWQYAVEKDRFKTSKTTQLSEMWVERQQELDHQRNPERAKHQLVKMKPLFAQQPAVDLVSGKRKCCTCSSILSGFDPIQGHYPKVMSFCIAPEQLTCDEYVGYTPPGEKTEPACHAVVAEFCSDPSVRECSSDKDHYSKAKSWDDA